jgi:hypothetical protein
MKWGVRNRSVTSAGFTQKRIGGGYKSAKTGKSVSRNAVSAQKRIDKIKLVASGKANKRQKAAVLATKIGITEIALAKGSIQKASQTKINKGKAFQEKSNAGGVKIRSALLKYGMGVKVSDLNYEV